jgi:hypothetical protein
MAKYQGEVGYVKSELTSPGIFKEIATEHIHSGDVLRENRRWDSTEHLNDNLVVSNRISIVADDFASKNFSNIRYIKWMDQYWKVTSVEVLRPRLILTIGGVYNGPKG